MSVQARLAAFLVGSALCGLAAAQQPATGLPQAAPSVTLYGPLEAGQEAYLRSEAERREAIAGQLQTVDRMAWYAGQPGYRYPPSLESVYAYPHVWAQGPTGVVMSFRVNPLGYRTYAYRGLFEPWPVVPGDLYGYPGLNRIPQPAGHEIVVTGPNGTLYRPVYPAPPVLPPTPASPQPAPPALPSAMEPLPTPPPEVGPREF